MYEATGKIKVIFDTQTFPSGFTKREFVLTVGDDYPQDIKFEMIKDKCSWLDQFKEGQQITAHFDIRGNEYKGRYYVNLNCWKITTDDKPNTSGNTQTPTTQATDNQETEPSPDDLVNDDIPF